MSSTTPLEPAAMVDFANAAGDFEGELESVPVMRAKGVVYLCDMPEDNDEVETFYTFNPKDMTEEEGVSVTGRVMSQRGRLVRMNDGWERARIGASPYDRVPCGGDLVEMACRNVVYYIYGLVG